MKKVALLGNSNNNFFSLVRHLRDRGYEANLFLLNNELPHFHPTADTYSLDFMQYTFNVPFGNPYWFLDEVERIKAHYASIIDFISEHDVIFACGSAMSFLEYFQLKVDFFVPYGMDIVQYPFFVDSANPNHRKHLDNFSEYQSRSISRCNYILGTKDMVNVESYSNSLKKLNVLNKLKTFLAFPYIYDKIYQKNIISYFFHKADWNDEFLTIRKQSDFIVFHHPRHTWKSCAGGLADKQNDKVFMAFAQILPHIKHLKPKIITFEYGTDYLETKQLIHALNIQDFVIWMPMMRRKDIMIGLHYADVGTGQFLVGCIGGGVQTEVLVSATPLIHYVDSLKYDVNHIYPYFQAQSIEEIAASLEQCACNQNNAKRIGCGGAQWMIEQIESSLHEICSLQPMH